ncbi:MAG: sigma-70 family RNA polymerase sigma factor [Tepidisphaeraceae bacterium]
MDEAISNLRTFVASRDPKAFEAIVRQYLKIVYAAARRQVHDAQLAEDVTQAVFIVLSQKAGRVPLDRPLSGWLLKTTGYVAANSLRAERRRREHERRAISMTSESTSDRRDDPWEGIEPLLDRGLAQLGSSNRDLVLWRFFESKSIGEIARQLQISEEAASKRLGRAVENLRGYFRQHGVATTAGVLTTMLASRTSEAAPAHLAGMITGTAHASTSSATLAKGAVILMMTTKIKAAAAVAALLIIVVGGGGTILYRSVAHSSVGDQPPASSQAIDSAPAPEADSGAIESAPAPEPDPAEIFQAAKAECYPDVVMKYVLSDRLSKLAADLDPGGEPPNQELMALDHTGKLWMAYVFAIDHVGKEPIVMGTTTFPGRIGVITDQGTFAPVEKTPVTDKPRYPGYSNMSVTPDQSWTGKEKSMLALYEGDRSGNRLQLGNWPGRVCVQQLVFIASKNWRVATSSLRPAATDVVGDFTIYLWQEKVKTATSGFSVNITLRRQAVAAPATRASGSGQ